MNACLKSFPTSGDAESGDQVVTTERHTDATWITLLATDETGGLQVGYQTSKSSESGGLRIHTWQNQKKQMETVMVTPYIPHTCSDEEYRADTIYYPLNANSYCSAACMPHVCR